ncbi:MAG: hypothetical protein J5944_02390 [Lentisphaeria bacterium]|nr:hypothetical protein [Lentisphaeria bacterium]
MSREIQGEFHRKATSAQSIWTLIFHSDSIGKDPAYVSRLIRLTLLAPEIVHAILAGTLQKSVSMETLRKELPVRWADQKKLFGVE